MAEPASAFDTRIVDVGDLVPDLELCDDKGNLVRLRERARENTLILFFYPRDNGIRCVERSIDRSELYRAEEVFLTGTGAKVSPVVEIDHYPVGSGTVGPIGKKIQDIYYAAVRGDEPKYREWIVDAYGG